MKTTFISVMALGVAVAMAGPADRAAAEPIVLSAEQLDQVTAGLSISVRLPPAPLPPGGPVPIPYPNVSSRTVNAPVVGSISIQFSEPPSVNVVPPHSIIIE
jgi:hypothetical protein